MSRKQPHLEDPETRNLRQRVESQGFLCLMDHANEAPATKNNLNVWNEGEDHQHGRAPADATSNSLFSQVTFDNNLLGLTTTDIGALSRDTGATPAAWNVGSVSNAAASFGHSNTNAAMEVYHPQATMGVEHVAVPTADLTSMNLSGYMPMLSSMQTSLDPTSQLLQSLLSGSSSQGLLPHLNPMQTHLGSSFTNLSGRSVPSHNVRTQPASSQTMAFLASTHHASNSSNPVGSLIFAGMPGTTNAHSFNELMTALMSSSSSLSHQQHQPQQQSTTPSASFVPWLPSSLDQPLSHTGSSEDSHSHSSAHLLTSAGAEAKRFAKAGPNAATTTNHYTKASLSAFESTTTTTSVPTRSLVSTGSRRPVTCSSDRAILSEYQRMLRAQMEFFDATDKDVNASAQGRNRPIRLGQVGLRCIHCQGFPPTHRPRGSVYYPAKLLGVYQSAQNMGINHFNGSCPYINPTIQNKMRKLRETKTPLVHGGGKQYWADKAEAVGVIEFEYGLAFGTILESTGSLTTQRKVCPGDKRANL